MAAESLVMGRKAFLKTFRSHIYSKSVVVYILEILQNAMFQCLSLELSKHILQWVRTGQFLCFLMSLYS